jgi:hypothetical protein
VTYTCNVPRLVCYREPLDACGQPIPTVAVPTAPAAVGVAPAAVGMVPAVVPPQEPTPAKPLPSAEVKPELGPETAAPRPLDAEEKPPVKEEAPMKAVPPPAKNPAPQSQVYPSKNS